MGDYAKAEPLLRQARDINPSNTLSLHVLSKLYLYMGDYAKAESMLVQNRRRQKIGPPNTPFAVWITAMLRLILSREGVRWGMSDGTESVERKCRTSF